MDHVTCSACGSVNPPGFRFCGSCGTSLERGCPDCGSVNPPGFRFCGTCGATLEAVGASAAQSEERKVVSSLFADLTASTDLATRLDPEDLRAVLKPFFDAMTEEIERFGGTVEKYIGDAVVAFFGVPVAHEDDSVRAIRAALAMQRRLAELNRELAAHAGGDLAMRIGVNTGEVFAHGGGIDEGLVTGESVNVAARFQALAEPGAIVVGERTRRDAADAFAFEPLGEVPVKGVDRPLAAWVVRGELPRPATPAVVAPFVGRTHETELLMLVFERTVRERRGNLVTLLGPPGIGKSRLALEVVSALERREPAPRVLRGRCLPYGDGLTYWPLAEIIKAEAGILDSDPPEEILRKATASLEPRLVGDDAIGATGVLLSSIGVSVPSDPLAGADAAAAQRMIARAWQHAFERIAAGRPVIAVIDDIHWADPRLLDLLETLVARIDAPVLFLCLSRPDLFERRPGWGGAVADAVRISLSPLSAGEGTALIEHLLGGDAPAEVVGPILHRSDGNPFFAAELLRMMTEDGTITRRDGRWVLDRELPSVLPDTVQAVIASRLDLLAPEEKRALQDASVVGRTFWEGVVERLAGRSVSARLEALVDKGLLLEHDRTSIEGEREFAFNHVLTRDVAYASVPRARLEDAHAAVASWIEERTSGRAEEFAEILAFHFGRAGDRPREAHHAMLAGHRHRRVFAAEEAIRWYERGLVALEAVGEQADVARCEIRVARGGALEQLGRFGEALEDYRAAVEGARRLGDAPLEARALAAEAHVLWLLDRYEEGGRVLPEALERARATGLTGLEARLLYTAGTMAFGRGAFDEALGYHERALSVASAATDDEARALALHGLCETRYFIGPVTEGLAAGREADAILRRLAQRPMIHHNEYMIGWLEWFVGDERAEPTVSASVEGCREVGNVRDEIMALNCRIELLTAHGRVREAVRDAARAMELADAIDAPRARMITAIVRADAWTEAWAFDRFREDARTSVDLGSALETRFMAGNRSALSAWLSLLDGDREAAARAFERAHDASFARLDRVWSSRTEVLAWESADDAEGLLAAAERERVPDELVAWAPWPAVAAALGRALRQEWDAALEAATLALGLARRGAERRAERRAARIAWLALRAIGRVDEAERMRSAALEAARLLADGMPDDLRTSFLARPDVADVLDV